MRSFFLYPHAGGHAEGSGDSGQYGDDDVENLSPDRILFHSYEFSVMSYFLSFEFFEL